MCFYLSVVLTFPEISSSLQRSLISLISVLVLFLPASRRHFPPKSEALVVAVGISLLSLPSLFKCHPPMLSRGIWSESSGAVLFEVLIEVPSSPECHYVTEMQKSTKSLRGGARRETEEGLEGKG